MNTQFLQKNFLEDFKNEKKGETDTGDRGTKEDLNLKNSSTFLPGLIRRLLRYGLNYMDLEFPP